jgi:hypothetical protein
MSLSRRRLLSLALIIGVALPLVVGCQFLVFKICLKNNTNFYLEAFAIKEAGALTYPPSALSDEVPPGGEGVVRGVTNGTYDMRADFDIADCDKGGLSSSVEITNVEINGTNLCIEFSQSSSCSAIYVTLDYVL